MTDPEQLALAETEARHRGMSFLVDGQYVSCDRVVILGGVDNVAAMRKAAAEARTARDELDQTERQINDSLIELLKAASTALHSNSGFIRMNVAMCLDKFLRLLP